jgi:hypothetical protein
MFTFSVRPTVLFPNSLTFSPESLYILYIYTLGVRARGIQIYMLINPWQELEYRLDICRATTGAHIEVYGRA